jgi:hypothetical protein
LKRKEVKNINKKLILPALAIAILVIGVVDAQTASAQNLTSTRNSLVEKIATKFNLNKDDVQKVFDEEHESRQAEMQTKMQERLSALVSQGKITETQKALILNKQKEIQEKRQQERETWQNLTPEERKSQMESRRSEMETWAKTNGVSIEFLQPKGMMGEGRGMHGPIQ